MLSKRQIENAFQALIDQLQEQKEISDEKVEFEINLLQRKGVNVGAAYVWISSSEVYWILVGRNADGTERVKEYPDPDWTPPDPDRISLSWGDEEEEEQPMIREQLPPIAALPRIKYTPEQYLNYVSTMRENMIHPLMEKLQGIVTYEDLEDEEDLKCILEGEALPGKYCEDIIKELIHLQRGIKLEEKAIGLQLGMVEYSEDITKIYLTEYQQLLDDPEHPFSPIEREATIEVERSMVRTDGSPTLISYSIPKWVMKSMLLKKFGKYSSKPGYPKIVFSKHKEPHLQEVTITYTNGVDSGFALQMGKVCTFSKADKPEVVYFTWKPSGKQGQFGRPRKRSWRRN